MPFTSSKSILNDSGDSMMGKDRAELDEMPSAPYVKRMEEKVLNVKRGRIEVTSAGVFGTEVTHGAAMIRFVIWCDVDKRVDSTSRRQKTIIIKTPQPETKR
jgi:hypothetical protein